ncbi:MAG TPA: methyltransferase domain-containing protein [Sporichthyaceae bacterium]|jgi:ubiquinone/menaquinone biosynthesis C-methylase UbiE|nr:methyltransferase domain-containing protein [Sporichthyaceae bacterium]
MNEDVAQLADAAREREYLLGARDDERQRLLGQGAAVRGQAAALLDRIGVESGWRVADLGCGPLGILDLLGERVGPDGRIVAVERDPRMVEHLTLSLKERGLSNVEIIEADATATGLAPGSFDLAHTRLVLVNVFAPGRVLAEMLRLVRPGGVVAAQEVDLSGFGCFPAHPSYDRLLAAVVAAWQDGRDPHVGRRVPGLFLDAGATDIHVDCFTLLQRQGDPNHRIVPFFAQLMREPILAADLLTADEVDELCAVVEDHLAQPGVITMWGPVYQVWGRRPT